MNSLLKIIFLFLITCIELMSIDNCPVQYNCKIENKKISGILSPHKLKECTLPNMPTFPITAENVFNSDGSLHDYFGFGAKNKILR